MGTVTIRAYNSGVRPPDPSDVVDARLILRCCVLVALGAVLVEADSYDGLLFKLYADGVLVSSLLITDGDPVRLPGGFLSNIYEVEVISTDIIHGISVAQNIFELAAG